MESRLLHPLPTHTPSQENRGLVPEHDSTHYPLIIIPVFTFQANGGGLTPGPEIKLEEREWRRCRTQTRVKNAPRVTLFLIPPQSRSSGRVFP